MLGDVEPVAGAYEVAELHNFALCYAERSVA